MGETRVWKRMRGAASVKSLSKMKVIVGTDDDDVDDDENGEDGC